MWKVRLRLLSLWVSQTTRVLADWMVRLFAVLEASGQGDLARQTGWHMATGVFIAPFLLLAPLNGPLTNALPRRRVLTVTSAVALAAAAFSVWTGGPWLACLAVVALAAAVNMPARFAMFPAAARDSHWPLPTVTGWMELGNTAAIIGGAALGFLLPQPGWPASGEPLAGQAVAVLLGLGLVSFLSALPTAFPSDVTRAEPPLQAVRGFFRDARRILRHPAACGPLLGIASFQALVTASTGALVALSLSAEQSAGGDLLLAMVLLGLGAAGGCVAAALQGHPIRNLGLVVPGSAGLLLALGWTLFTATPGAGLPWGPCLLLGFTGALVNTPLRAAYLSGVPDDARGNGMSVLGAGIYAITIALSGTLVGLVWAGILAGPQAQLACLSALAAGGLFVSARLLWIPTLHLVIELLFLPFYRIRAHGPGVDAIPTSGPLLVVANHASYLDPFWLGKIIPRWFVPMMTSAFFDKPGIRWLMVHVVKAIRVPVAEFRREAPELADAVRVLRAGGCVMIFPEGRLRRDERPIARPFGQGVWHILRELPDTPVLVCWIEGGWGSYASYWNGPPMKNKRPDRLRPIDIAFSLPEALPADVLSDQKATRGYLRRRCLLARCYLGLDVPEDEVPMRGEVYTENSPASSLESDTLL